MNYKRDFQDGRTETSFGALHYKHHSGKGRKLVFLHGLGATTLVWKRVAEQLPDDLDVYLVDLLGHGLSDSPEIDYNIKTQVEALWEFCEKQNLERFNLIGHSYGGWVAAYYASKYAVAGLVLVDAAGLKEAFDEIVAAKRVDEYKNSFYKMAMQMSGNKEHVIKSILDFDFREDQLTDEVLAEITEPTLIIWGGTDLMLNPAMGQILQKKIKNSKLQVIAGAGHDPHFTHTEKFVEILLAFVK